MVVVLYIYSPPNHCLIDSIVIICTPLTHQIACLCIQSFTFVNINLLFSKRLLDSICFNLSLLLYDAHATIEQLHLKLMIRSMYCLVLPLLQTNKNPSLLPYKVIYSSYWQRFGELKQSQAIFCAVTVCAYWT